MKPRLAFDSEFFAQVNDNREGEGRGRSRALNLIVCLLNIKMVQLILGVCEEFISFLLSLPIPIYRTGVLIFVTALPGMPWMFGMYVRSLYYRRVLGKIGKNVLIDKGVIFAHPTGVQLEDFCYIDKNVWLMAKYCQVGRRVHLAPKVFVSGGGDFVIEDYACVATNASIITSTEIMKNGARCSGPMVTFDQRNVHRGHVIIRKDAFVGAGAILLTDVVLGEGCVIGAGVVMSKSTEPWKIYVGPRPSQIAEREVVRWPNN